MRPDNKMTIVTAFSNAPRMYVNGGAEGLENIKYNVNENVCEMMLDNTYLLDGGGASGKAIKLFVEYLVE